MRIMGLEPVNSEALVGKQKRDLQETAQHQVLRTGSSFLREK
jgi:hypothetical protein